ncbi:MAG: P-loop NTPase [Calditrichaeota bacterium]|nr:P-loop NTPase [Calditrichota bacterium]
MILAIASGKGGTGKTTVAVNLAKVVNSHVQLLDCDVEAPNDHLFLNGTVRNEVIVNVLIPSVDESLCDACGECSQFCEFNAIVSLKTTPLVFPELCHSCGGCLEVCPQKAIREVPHRVGVIQISEKDNITLTQGRIDIGVAMSPPIIRAVKERIQTRDYTIIDAPPGTSCPVIAAIKGVDFVALVTEPTPFGLHDLKLAIDMVREINIPFGVIINRVGIGDNRVHSLCEQEGIPILMEIPDDRRIAEAYSRGELIVEALPEYRQYFTDFLKQIVKGLPG